MVAARERRIHIGVRPHEIGQRLAKRAQRSMERKVVGTLAFRRGGRDRHASHRRARRARDIVHGAAHGLSIAPRKQLVDCLALVGLLLVAANQVERLIGHHLVVGAIIYIDRYAELLARLARAVGDGRVVHGLDGDGRNAARHHGDKRRICLVGIAVGKPQVGHDELAGDIHVVPIVLRRNIHNAHVVHRSRPGMGNGRKKTNAAECR